MYVAAGGSQESAQAPMPNPAIITSPFSRSWPLSTDPDRETTLIQTSMMLYLSLIVLVILGKMKQRTPKATKVGTSLP